MPADAVASGENGRRWWLSVAAIGIVAFALRLYYFVDARIDDPLRGDIVQYVNYALNLVKYGTFSSAVAPDHVTGTVPPDAFRGPGYPFFLAIWTWMSGGGPAAYLLSVLGQIIMGSLLAPLAIVWCRRWMPATAALLVGAAVAVWPHLVVFSSTLLSETMFATEIVLFLLLASRTFSGGRTAPWWAGVVGGVAYLTNPVFALFPPAVAALLWCLRNRRGALVLLAGYLMVVGAWSIRNAAHPGMAGAWDRAAMNLVQGSWPTYHDAVNLRDSNPAAALEFAAIVREQTTLQKDPGAGLRIVGARLAADPGPYLAWYAWQKPVLLWGWSIRLGWGDIYFLKTPRSPYEQEWPFRTLRNILRWLNPGVLAAAALAVLIVVRRSMKVRSWMPGDADRFLAASLFIYVTLVHTLLQAEPRYAVAYRPLELALAIYALSVIFAPLLGRLRADASGPRGD